MRCKVWRSLSDHIPISKHPTLNPHPSIEARTLHGGTDPTPESQIPAPAHLNPNPEHIRVGGGVQVVGGAEVVGRRSGGGGGQGRGGGRSVLQVYLTYTV